jgi:hypothetical protein
MNLFVSKLFRRMVGYSVILCLWLGMEIPCASAIEWQWALQAGIRFNHKRNGLDFFSSPPSFNEDLTGGSLLLGFLALISLHRQIELGLTLDMGELLIAQRQRQNRDQFAVLLNDQRLNFTSRETGLFEEQVRLCEEQAEKQGIPKSECHNPATLLLENLFIRELYLTFYLAKRQWIELNLGMFHRSLGRGFILDNYVLGLYLDVDWSKRTKPHNLPLRIEFDAFLPNSSFTAEGKQSPTLNLKFSYKFSENYAISFFSTYLYDGNNLAGKNFLPLWGELWTNYLNEWVAARTGDYTHFSCERTPTDADIYRLSTTFPSASREEATSYVLDFLNKACNRLPSSSGHHLWLGLEGKWHWQNKLIIEGALIFYISQMELSFPEKLQIYSPSSLEVIVKDLHQTQSANRALINSQRSSISPHQDSESPIAVPIQKAQISGISFLGELQMSYRWNRPITTSVFFLFAMGDGFEQRKQTIHAFMGISPQIRYTDVFFHGGINAYSSKRGISISGISGRGYTGPGFKFNYSIKEQFEVRLTTAAFWSIKAPVFQDIEGKSGNFYGLEVNLIASYTMRLGKVADKPMSIKPVVQIDLFFPGNFFAASTPPIAMFQVLAGLDLLWF